jgi:hypothetical protein
MKIPEKSILSILLLALGIAAQYDNAATAAFPFLNIGVDARSLGMGDAGVGMANDLYGGVSNPATLAYPLRMQAMLAYKPIMLDVRAGALGFSSPVTGKGTFGIHLSYVSYGIINEVDKFNVLQNQTWSPYSLIGALSWAKLLYQDFALGLTLKGIYHNLDHGHSADGAAADIGIQYRMLSSRLVLGALLRNMGFVRKWYSDDDTQDRVLPFAAATGLSYLPRAFPSLRMAVDLEKTIDDYLNYKTGLEMALYKQYLFARLGYRFSHRDLRELFRIIKNESNDSYQKTTWSSLTIGLGIYALVAATEVKIDAALVLHTEGLPPTPALSAIIGF